MSQGIGARMQGHYEEEQEAQKKTTGWRRTRSSAASPTSSSPSSSPLSAALNRYPFQQHQSAALSSHTSLVAGTVKNAGDEIGLWSSVGTSSKDAAANLLDIILTTLISRRDLRQGWLNVLPRMSGSQLHRRCCRKSSCCHLREDGCDSDGSQFEGTKVKANSHSDIAITKSKSKTPLPSAKLRATGKIQPGDWMLALGCPLSLQNIVTSGIVSWWIEDVVVEL